MPGLIMGALGAAGAYTAQASNENIAQIDKASLMERQAKLDEAKQMAIHRDATDYSVAAANRQRQAGADRVNTAAGLIAQERADRTPSLSVVGDESTLTDEQRQSLIDNKPMIDDADRQNRLEIAKRLAQDPGIIAQGAMTTGDVPYATMATLNQKSEAMQSREMMAQLHWDTMAQIGAGHDMTRELVAAMKDPKASAADRYDAYGKLGTIASTANQALMRAKENGLDRSDPKRYNLLGDTADLANEALRQHLRGVVSGTAPSRGSSAAPPAAPVSAAPGAPPAASATGNNALDIASLFVGQGVPADTADKLAKAAMTPGNFIVKDGKRYIRMDGQLYTAPDGLGNAPAAGAPRPPAAQPAPVAAPVPSVPAPAAASFAPTPEMEARVKAEQIAIAKREIARYSPEVREYAMRRAAAYKAAADAEERKKDAEREARRQNMAKPNGLYS